MATTIISKHGEDVPLDTDLVQGELAVDLKNKRIYSKDPDGNVVQLGSDIEGIDGLQDALDTEKQERIDADADLQNQIDDLDLSGTIEEAPEDGKQYARKDANWSEIEDTGSSVHIGDTPPANPQEGQQWMEVPADGDATMWIYDGANWLQQPGGKDGASGVDGLWTDNGGNSISYDGDVVIGSGSGGSSHPYTDLLLESNNHAAIQISTPSGKEQALWFSDEDATAAGGIAYNHLNDEMAFRINDDVRMTIDADGNVGINANSETPLTIGKTGTTALWEWDLQAGAVDSIRLSAKNPSGGYYAQDALVVDSGGTVTVNGDLLAAKAGAGDYAVGVGYRAGMNDQSVSAVAVGVWAGESNQGAEAVAVGKKAGQTSQGDYATALGDGAGKTDQGAYSTAVGVNAGETSQSVGAVGVGDQAGRTNQGQYSVAIGRYAGRSNQAANGIIISSNASAVDSSSVGHIIIKSTTQDLRSMHGGGFAMNGDPIIGTRKLISTLSTLRNATKDETTLEGMRDALADAIGGLIEGLEHEIATQEIAE
jgi:hypothetical protein